VATGTFIFVILVEALTIGGLTLLYPLIARRGLLFGVYVGEERWDSAEAQLITRAWRKGMVLMSLAGAGLCIAFYLWYRNPIGKMIALIALPLMLTLGTLVVYLRAYYRAQGLAAPGIPPPGVALLQLPEVGRTFPLVVVTVGILCGLGAVTYAAMHYAELPAQVPTHFGPSGRPDAWRPKSFWTVMLLPLLTLVMGSGLGIMALLISRAKRAIRFPNAEISADAQMRFRRAITRFFCGITLVVTAMLSLGSVGSIRVGLGLDQSLSPLMMVAGIGVVVWALGGTLYLVLHYGQGGARLERGAGNAALTNGLADNRYWVLGMFYVNRDDPSIFVERRFGFGYTINFGNPKAVVFFLGFIILILGIALAGVLKG
jgi:uncharacterized membrane protein